LFYHIEFGWIIKETISPTRYHTQKKKKKRTSRFWSTRASDRTPTACFFKVRRGLTKSCFSLNSLFAQVQTPRKSCVVRVVTHSVKIWRAPVIAIFQKKQHFNPKTCHRRRVRAYQTYIMSRK